VFALLGSLGIVGVPNADQAANSGPEAKLAALVAELKTVKASSPELGQELLQMGEEDQRLRAEGQKLWEAKGPDSAEAKAVWDRQSALDRTNQTRLKEIIEARGWPGVKLVGLAAADAAFLIVQHAALDAQKKYLPLLQAAVKRRDALPAWAAMLEDRVLVGEGRPQIFGTQLLMPPGSTKWELCPIRDASHVDARRASVGLGPLADYLKNFGIDYRSPKGRDRSGRSIADIDTLTDTLRSGLR
jgi:hypothetical protein